VHTGADQIRIGKVTRPLTQAIEWVRAYTDVKRNRTDPEPYAYPAYDHFQAGRDDPNRLSDADLLVPGLLNAPVSIRSFYALQALREPLGSALRQPDLLLPLATIDAPDRIAAMVHPLYAVLDQSSRPHGVLETTLSKILHRKRPHSIVLHDRWIRACYLGTDTVPHTHHRRSADYMAAVTTAIAADIREQPQAFAALDDATSTPGDLTPVRLLDIVAWKSHGSSRDSGSA
jgi:hypothetical protein